jgi:hypothetical protein
VLKFSFIEERQTLAQLGRRPERRIAPRICFAKHEQAP